MGAKDRKFIAETTSLTVNLALVEKVMDSLWKGRKFARGTFVEIDCRGLYETFRTGITHWKEFEGIEERPF